MAKMTKKAEREAEDREDQDQAQVDPQAEQVETSANDALKRLQDGDLAVLETVGADQLAALRTLFKDWASAEQATLKGRCEQAYQYILNEMAKKGVPY